MRSLTRRIPDRMEAAIYSLLVKRFLTPNRIIATYVVLGTTYVLAGSAAIFWNEPSQSWMFDSLKDLSFVGASAFVLQTMIRRLVARYEVAEAALRASDERWNAALEGAGDGVWDWNCETGETFYSPRWKAILGYAENEVGATYEEWKKRIHPDDLNQVVEQMRLHFSGQTEVYHCEHRLRAKDGSYKWVVSRGRVVKRAPDGTALRAVGTQNDISERKAIEMRMVDALNFTQAVLRAVPVGILTYRADGQVASANPAAVKFVGADYATVMSQNFRKLKTWAQFGLVEMADQVLEKGTVVTRRGRYVTSAGRENWSEMTFASFDFGGERRLLLIVQDITEHQRTSQQLELLHAALRAAPSGWVVTDAQGVIEWVNPGFTKLTGYSWEEAVGQRPNVLKSGQHRPDFYAKLWETVRGGQIWQGELCNRRKDGSLYYEHMTIAPVRDASGVISHFVAMKEDITGQHELEQQLNRSQRLESIGLIASGIAHDLNNVLAPILLSVGLISSRYKDRETHDLLDMMQSAAQRGASDL